MVRLSVEWFTRAENNQWLGWKRITQNVHTAKQKFKVKILHMGVGRQFVAA